MSLLSPSSPLAQHLEASERSCILSYLERNHWNRAGTARELRVSYRTLLYKIDRLRIVPPEKEEVCASVPA